MTITRRRAMQAFALAGTTAAADAIALDATGRARNGEPVGELIPLVRARTGKPVMADVATLEEGVRAALLGADAVATTLSGYTDGTAAPSGAGPDLDLVAAFAVPGIAEGRFRTPGEVREAFRLGATPWWSAPRSPIRARSRSGSRPG